MQIDPCLIADCATYVGLYCSQVVYIGYCSVMAAADRPWRHCVDREMREKTNKMQQMFIFNNISTCFGHHYAHLQENKTLLHAAHHMQ